MHEALGRHHPLLRRVRALRRDGALRRQQGVFVAEGLHLAEEALAAGAEIEAALVAPRLGATDEGRRLRVALEAQVEAFHEAADTVVDSLQEARSPQPVLLLVRHREPTAELALGPRDLDPLVLVAVGVQDPGNLGGLVRTALAAGATGCFVGEGSADPLHPRAVRATAGAIFRLPVVVASTNARLVELLRARGLRLVGTAARAAIDYDACSFSGPLAIFLGGEGAGLPPEVAGSLDGSVRVPTGPAVESLSVGAAAAVVLFEAARQRRR